MTNMRAFFIVAAMVIGLIMPNFAVAMLFMGMAIGGFLVLVIF